MGAAFTRFLVKAPAAVQGTSETIRATSGFPLLLIPQAVPAPRKPVGAVTPPSISCHAMLRTPP